MLKLDMRKIYNFHPVEPTPDAGNLPTAGDIYYECLECSVIVSSVPLIKSECGCGNLAGAGGKVDVKNPVRIRVVRGKLK